MLIVFNIDEYDKKVIDLSQYGDSAEIEFDDRIVIELNENKSHKITLSIRKDVELLIDLWNDIRSLANKNVTGIEIYDNDMNLIRRYDKKLISLIMNNNIGIKTLEYNQVVELFVEV